MIEEVIEIGAVETVVDRGNLVTEGICFRICIGWFLHSMRLRRSNQLRHCYTFFCLLDWELGS